MNAFRKKIVFFKKNYYLTESEENSVFLKNYYPIESEENIVSI